MVLPFATERLQRNAIVESARCVWLSADCGHISRDLANTCAHCAAPGPRSFCYRELDCIVVTSRVPAEPLLIHRSRDTNDRLFRAK